MGICDYMLQVQRQGVFSGIAWTALTRPGSAVSFKSFNAGRRAAASRLQALQHNCDVCKEVCNGHNERNVPTSIARCWFHRCSVQRNGRTTTTIGITDFDSIVHAGCLPGAAAHVKFGSCHFLGSIARMHRRVVRNMSFAALNGSVDVAETIVVRPIVLHKPLWHRPITLWYGNVIGRKAVPPSTRCLCPCESGV